MRRKRSLALMVLLYVVAGLNHFLNRRMYLAIIPTYLPHPLTLVYISGVCEIAFGLLLIPVATQRIAAWLIILLLIAVFPANVQMAVNYYLAHNPWLWLAIIRLPIQLLLIRWAWFFTKNKKNKLLK